MTSKLDDLINKLEVKSSNLLTKINENTKLISRLSQLQESITDSDNKIENISKKITNTDKFIKNLDSLNLRSTFLESQLQLIDLYKGNDIYIRNDNVDQIKSWKDSNLNIITTENTLENINLEYEFFKKKLSSFSSSTLNSITRSISNNNESDDSLLRLQQAVQETPSQLHDSLILKPLRCQSTRVYKKKSRYRLSQIYNLNPINLSTPNPPKVSQLNTPTMEEFDHSSSTTTSHAYIESPIQSLNFNFANHKKSNSLPEAETPSLDNFQFNTDLNEIDDYLSLLRKNSHENNDKNSDDELKKLKHYMSYDTYPRLRNPPKLKLNLKLNHYDDLDELNEINEVGKHSLIDDTTINNSKSYHNNYISVDDCSDLESIYSELSDMNENTNTTNNSVCKFDTLRNPLLGHVPSNNSLNLKRFNSDDKADNLQTKKSFNVKFNNPTKISNSNSPITEVSNDLIYGENTIHKPSFQIDKSMMSFKFKFGKNDISSKSLLNQVASNNYINKSDKNNSILPKMPFLPLSKSKISEPVTSTPTSEFAPIIPTNPSPNIHQQQPIISQWKNIFRFPTIKFNTDELSRPISEIGKPTINITKTHTKSNSITSIKELSSSRDGHKRNISHPDIDCSRQVTKRDYNPIKGSYSQLIIGKNHETVIKHGNSSSFHRPLVSKISYGALKEALANDLEFN